MTPTRQDNILELQIAFLDTLRQDWFISNIDLAQLLNKYSIFGFIEDNYDKLESADSLEAIEEHIVLQGGCIYHNLTPNQIRMKFRLQTVGLTNIQFRDDGSILTADVVYSNYTEDRQQQNMNSNIIAYTPDDLESAGGKATTKEEAIALFNHYNLKVEEVEPSVFKVLNPEEQLINLNEFSYEFERITLLTSRVEIACIGNDTMDTYRVANVYYIMLVFTNPQQLYKYATQCNSERETEILRFLPEEPPIESYRQWKKECKKESFRKTHEEALAIFQKHDIQVEQVEPLVYKILNPFDHIVNITDLEGNLGECIIIGDHNKEIHMYENWYSFDVGNIYYISLDYENDDITNKYFELVEQEYKLQSRITGYKYRPRENDLYNLWNSQGIE